MTKQRRYRRFKMYNRVKSETSPCIPVLSFLTTQFPPQGWTSYHGHRSSLRAITGIQANKWMCIFFPTLPFTQMVTYYLLGRTLLISLHHLALIPRLIPQLQLTPLYGSPLLVPWSQKKLLGCFQSFTFLMLQWIAWHRCHLIYL